MSGVPKDEFNTEGVDHECSSFDKLLERLAEFGWEGGELDEDDLEQYDIAPYEEDEEETD